MNRILTSLILSVIIYEFFFAALPSYGETHDSVPKGNKEVMLKELVVESVSRKDTEEGVTFFPTIQEKKFSYDAISLIQNMALPELVYNPASGQVSTSNSEAVAFFIDGVAANKNQLTALNPKDVDRIEFLPNPTDARYKGKSNVVNYVMKKYLDGGFTKGLVQQNIPFMIGKYSLNSRFETGKMTYDAFVGTNYTDYKHLEQVNEQIFKDIEYDGMPYDKICMTSGYENGRERRNDVSAAFSANYQNGNMQWQTMLTWNWMQIPVSSFFSKTEYDPAVIISNGYENLSYALGNNPHLQTNMNLKMKNKQALSVTVEADYGYYKNRSLYAPENLSSIYNESRDRQWNTYLDVSYSKGFGNGDVINIQLFNTVGGNDIKYAGSSDGKTERTDFSSGLFVKYAHSFGKKTTLSVTLGVTQETDKLDGVVKTYWYPRYNFSLRHKWNSKSTFNLSSFMQNVGYLAGMRNNIIIRQTELMWKEGNPNLRARLQWQNSLSNSWNPTRNLSMTANVRYVVFFHRDLTTWYTHPDYDGLISMVTDHSTTHSLSVGPNVTLRLFSRKLILSGNFRYNFFKTSGVYDQFYPFWNGSISAKYNLKNWSFSGYYTPAHSSLSNITKTYNRDYYYLCAEYATGPFTFKFIADNLFKCSRKGAISSVDTSHYSYVSHSGSDTSGRFFRLILSYTLSYGKKVSRDENYVREIGKSGALSL